MDVVGYMSVPYAATFLLALLIVLLFRYATRKHKYWKERGLPYAKAVPIFGSVLETFSKPLNQIEEERYKKYGKIYGHYEGSNPVISVGDPAILRNIIIKDFHAFSGRRRLDCGDSVMDSMLSNLNGEDWKRVRTIITPAFTTGKMKKMLSIFKDCAETCRKNFLKYAKEGKSVEVKVIYGTFTMDVIASSAFSTKIDSHNDPNNKFVAAAKHVFVRSFSWRVGLYIMFPTISRFFQIGLIPPKALKFFKKVTLDIVQERKRTGQTRNDFLQLLLDTAKEVDDYEKTEIPEKEDITANYGKEGWNHALFSNISKKTLSHDELVAQGIIFFLAGYETTASTLSFASYLLALNPDIQEKLIAEIDQALTESNGELTYDVLQRLKYLDNVISETFRIYSPAARLERVADENYDLKDVGITIPKGMIVTVPICALQKDPEYFPDPEKFDPDRFRPEERAERNPFTYMPFGAGPRNCIGMRFALLEMKMCLAVLLSQFRIRRCPETKVPLEFFPGQQPMQPKDLRLKMEVRKDAIVVR